MTTVNSRRYRDARDRLIDSLGLGETYPLRDLPIRDEGLTQPFGTVAKIPLETSQRDVRYQLVDKTGANVGDAVVGTGETLILTTPPVSEDVTYTVRARKPTGRTADLLETATVKVGLDITLAARILRPVGKPAMADFGDEIEVEIPLSQEGVDYRLVHFPDGEPPDPTDMASAAADRILSKGDASVRGTGAAIVLRSKPMAEDTLIRIRATKIFDGMAARPPQTNLLKVVLPLLVRANPALAVTLEPGPILDFRGEGRLRLAKTQASARYQAFARRLRDRDFRHGAPPGTAMTVRVAVPDEEDAVIAIPALPAEGAEIEGFRPLLAEQVGGGDLRQPIPPLEHDTLILVRARKKHTDADAATIETAVWLRSVAAVLVRPDPRPRLQLAVVVKGDATTGMLEVAGGQPGVFYLPRVVPAGPEFRLPAYVHQSDDDDLRLNKGLDQLKIGVDFVVARDGGNGTPAAMRRPATPQLEGPPLAFDTRLALRATKAQTRVATDLAEEAAITKPAAAALASPVVDFGTEAVVVVAASRANEVYALVLDGRSLMAPQRGNGQDLELRSGPLRRDAVIELRATVEGAPIPVERRQPLPVAVRPDTSLRVIARPAAVARNEATVIFVERSELGVRYQLRVGNTDVGNSVAGSGDTIALPTGPLAADTTFRVRASKAAAPEVAVLLAATVTVTVTGGTP